MAQNSSTAGYLIPNAEPIYDNDLDDLFQTVVVGIVGLPGRLVRPRWQPNPPQQPPFNENWCALGIMRNTSDAFAYEKLVSGTNGNADGAVLIERDELIYVMHSMYGPGAAANSKRLRDGLEISQNRDALIAAGVALVEVEESITAPALLQETWVRRVDTQVVFRRRTSRAYPVLTIESGQIGLNNERYVTPITVNNP
jgi:hypothetical protein